LSDTTADKTVEDEVFFTALQIADPGERKAFIDQACAGKPALRSLVEEMLASEKEAERWLSLEPSTLARTVAELEANASKPGAAGHKPVDSQVGGRIDCYKVLERIGEGGCGVVYMAEQESPVQRRVALKVIRPGMDTERVIARFEAERQALALMEHPNIARVLDAGATEAGRPYFVMELVQGVRITDYCDQQNLDSRQRLDLFIQVCRAIQHAHQKGVIHRDIKPSNILVTFQDGVPVPRVIDFGIAKAIEGKLTQQTLFTPSEQLVGTPAYMSPEQADISGVDVDTRSDIYSLGVVLYELLTGKTPFDSKELARSGLGELRRTLRETEPQRPSRILTTLEGAELRSTAEHRQVEPPKLISLLKGDLDWIVMKALDKDRSRRYETVNGLARDIERYLNNEPVVARPPSRLYRLRKLVRRNRVVFGAAGAVALALIIGLGTSTWLLFRERELRQRAVAAEQEQARLRGIAERGLATEAELRRQAEGRGKITEAASLINRGAFAEADALIAQLPLKQSTMEGAAVFRALGEWNVIQQRWPAARDRFLLLDHASQADEPGYTSLDSTRTAVTLVECGDREGYQQYCLETTKRYANTVDPIVAERAVKNCLLLPRNEALIKALDPLAQVAHKSLERVNFLEKNADWQVPYRCLSLALWEYRVGNLSEAIVWSRRCLNYGGPMPRVASARTVLAMALYRLGESEAANSELGQARTPIEAKFKVPLDAGNPGEGYWFDWLLGRILLREATGLMGKVSATPEGP
jgi:eukaryotic-like serine/threonine-protein kinase